jgi:CheY-like chemotaxis protein
MENPKLDNWRVLVVDDEPDSIDVVTMVLSASGATVFTAANGQDGLEIFKQSQLTLILTDLSMPDMDGWELLKKIRQSENGHTTPVIALTAHAMSGDKERVMAGGFDGYLSKPLKMFTLLDDLKSCLASKKPGLP